MIPVFDVCKDANFFSFSIKVLLAVVCARIEVAVVRWVLPSEGTRRHLRRRSMRADFGRLLSFEVPEVSRNVSFRRELFRSLRFPISHENKRERFSVSWYRDLLSGFRCSPAIIIKI